VRADALAVVNGGGLIEVWHDDDEFLAADPGREGAVGCLLGVEPEQVG
jgi:hypothetical protein